VNLITRQPEAQQKDEDATRTVPLKEFLSRHVQQSEADSQTQLELMIGGHSAGQLALSAVDESASYYFSHLQSRNNFEFTRSGGERATRQNNEVFSDSLWASWLDGDLAQRAGLLHSRRGLAGSAEFPTLFARLAQDTLWWQGTADDWRADLLVDHTRATDPQPYLNSGPIDNSDTRVHTEFAAGSLAQKDEQCGWRIRSDFAEGSTSGSHRRVGLDLHHSLSSQSGAWLFDLDLGLVASSDIGADPTLRAGATRLVGKDSRIYSSLGYSVRHPDFGELYLTDAGSVEGNPELAPESALSAEIGANATSGATRIAASVYYSDYRDSIIFAPVSAYLVRAINTGPARVAGLETLIDTELAERLWLRNAYTWLPLAEFDSGIPLTHRSEHHLHSTLDYAADEWGAELSVDYSAAIPADLFGNLRIAERAIVGLELSRKYDDSELRLNISNVFDAHTRDSWNYPLPGREVFLSWRTDL
jgi:outer membrane receptor protein involved in Fe transport